MSQQEADRPDAATEQLLNDLLEMVERCQRDMLDLNFQEVYANCLSALSESVGGGLSVLLTPDGRGRLELELASDSLPIEARLLEVELPAPGPATAPGSEEHGRVIATAVQSLFAAVVPDRKAFVEALAHHDELVGVLVQLSRPGQDLSVAQRETLQRLTGVIRLVLRATHQFQALLQRAAIDPMTGLYNQRYFTSRLRSELSRASRHGHSLGLLFFDLDDFETCNRALGFAAGNHLLQEVADLLRSSDQVPGARFSFRRSDVPVRHSGEEFVVLLPETPKWGVLTKAERLRKAIEGLELPAAQGDPLRLTASIGVAAFPEDASDATSLIEAAVRAMARAKESGKNRVEPA